MSPAGANKHPQDLTVVDGAAAGAWIAPRLEGGFGGQVRQLTPNGYDAYLRVFHPLVDPAGEPTTWAGVAEALGRTAHREMQWHRLLGRSEPLRGWSNAPWDHDGGEWRGSDPMLGEIEEPLLRDLCAVLARHTADPTACHFGLSTIHGGVEDAYPNARLLRWRARDFVVFFGPLSAADQVGYEAKETWSTGAWPDGRRERIPDPAQWGAQPPNLIWPADRSWFAQTDVDLDSTVIGGSRALADALLEAPALEVWEVERTDSLEAHADRIN